MWVSKLARVCLFALVLLRASVALGTERHVVLIAGAGDDPVATRIKSELRVLGVDAVVRSPEPELSVELIARRESAAAVAVIEAQSVSLLVTREDSAAQRLRVTRQENEAPELLALRAVELLRGTLIDVPRAAGEPAQPASNDGDSRRKQENAAESTARHAAPVQPERRAPEAESTDAPAARVPPAEFRDTNARVGLLLAPAAAVSPGGLTPAGQLRFDASWIPVANWSLGLTFFAPLGGATAAVRGAELDLRVLALGLSLRRSFLDATSRWGLAAAAGAGFSYASYQTRFNGVFESVDGSQWSAVPWLGMDALYRLHRVVALRADALAGVLWPELRIPGNRTANASPAGSETLAEFGRPIVWTSLGLYVEL